MFSSPTSIYSLCASTKCCSIAFSSSDSSMNTRSTNVAPGRVCFLACQLLLLLRKKLNYRCSNSIYIVNYYLCKLHLLIICFSFCTFQRWWMRCRPHSQWLNIQRAFFICFSTFVFLNNSASSSCLHLCSLLCTSFSFDIIYNFSITLFTLMLLWTPKLWKCTQFPTIDTNYFWQLPLFLSFNLLPITFIFLLACCLLINAWSSKLIQSITISLCVSFV